MNVLSLFDGMSCGRIALQRAGVDVETYYSSEIDKYALTVADANWPQDSPNRLGDVTRWREWDIDWSTIDLVIGGFPCQSWSISGKGGGDTDERGMLFWVMLDVMKKVKAHNPDMKFLIENVKMKREFEEYITSHTESALGYVNKVLINSSLLSAQNRQRYYWTNWEVSHPRDNGIVLSSIIENGYVDRDKSYCIDANYYKGGNLKSYFEKKRRQIVFIWDDEYRKLTPLECERLQTIPPGYTAHVSNTQRYKMCGNGWTVDVIAHILREGAL